MSEFGVELQRCIDAYRQANDLGYVITDEAVLELIQKDLESGKIPVGFEFLAADAVKSRQSGGNLGIFGTGFANNAGDGYQSSTQTIPSRMPAEAEMAALYFLGDITNQSEAMVEERDREAGAMSAVVNTWQEFFNKQYAKSTVKDKVKDSKSDLELLQKAAFGQVTKFNYITLSDEVISFEDMFKKRRGVKFSEEAIAECSEKAKAYTTVKTSVDMINTLQDVLAEVTEGDVNDQMYPQKASSEIIKAFQMAGIKTLEDMNSTLKQIEEKYKDSPAIQKYGGDFRLAKNNNGQYVIYRTDKNGYPAEATNEELKIIALEMSVRLDKTLADALGVEYNPNATPEEMSAIIQQTYDKYQREYEDSFKKAYGDKDLKILAEEYIQKQQQGVAYIEMGLNIASMALMLAPGGAVASSGWLLKGAAAGSKVMSTTLKVAKGVAAVQKAASPVLAANMTLRPTELIEQLSSENGMSKEEWEEWGKSVLQNTVYMAAGMKASQLAESGAALYKTKALVNTLKKSGKSVKDIAAMVKANPVKFPDDIVASFKKIDNLAKALQISTESALDISSSYLLNKAMGNGDLTLTDWINSVAFAISGGVLQKQFAHLATDVKVKYLQDAFRSVEISADEARRILQAMDDISAGKLKPGRADGSAEGEVSAEVHKEPDTAAETAADTHEADKLGQTNKKGLFTGFVNGIKNNSKIKSYMKEHYLDGKENSAIVENVMKKVLDKNPNINLENAEKVLRYLSYGGIGIEDSFDSICEIIVKCSENKGVLNTLGEMLDSASSGDLDLGELSKLLNSIVDNNLSSEQISALLLETSKQQVKSDGINSASRWDRLNFNRINTIVDLMPILKKLNPYQLSEIREIAKIENSFENMNGLLLTNKKSILRVIRSIPEEVKDEFEQQGFHIRNLETQLSLASTFKGYDIQTDNVSRNRFLKSIIANNNMQAGNILSGEAFASYLKEHSLSGLPLDYSRQSFTTDLKKVLADLEHADRQKVLQQLNININGDSFSGFVKPEGIRIADFSPDVQENIINIQKIANKFVHSNEIKCDNPEIKSLLNDLLQGFPEFVSVIGKQDGGHNNTLDIHILEVLNNAMKHPEYAKLSDTDKTVLKFSILLHDLGKLEGVNDSGMHSAGSAIYANSILDKFSLGQETKERIVNMVRHHHFSIENSENFSKYFRTSGDAAVAKIMAQSDYKSRFGEELPVSRYFASSLNNPMLVHKNPMAAKKYPKITRTIDGKTYEVPVLDCSKLSPDTDMSQYGYPKGTKLKDITVQVHNVSNPYNIRNILENYIDPNFDMTLSTSLRKLTSSASSYGDFGVILSTTKMNRGGGRFYDKINGLYGKGFDEFFYPEAARFVKESSDIDYLTATDIDRYFATLDYPSQIKEQKIGDRIFTKEELTKLWNDANEEATSLSVNEIFALNPKVEQIIIHKSMSPEEIPEVLIKLSEEYNVPIIIMPE